MASEKENGHDAKALLPPYVAFRSLKTLFSNLKEHGVPNRIDRTILVKSFSGIVGSQLLTSLRFLKLTDGTNKPTEQMYELVQSYGTDVWSKRLLETLQAAYEPIFTLELEFTTAGEFNEKFRKSYSATDDVLRKCITFFLNAMRETPTKISPYLLQNTKPRSGPTKKRAARKADAKGKKQTVDDDGEDDDDNNSRHASRKLSELVLEMLDDDKLSKDVEAAVFVVLKHLRKEGK